MDNEVRGMAKAVLWSWLVGLVWALAACSAARPFVATRKSDGTRVAAHSATAVKGTGTIIVTPTRTAVPSQHGEQLLGESWEGRPIIGHWFGKGPRKVVLVGNIHGGTEENTHRLALEMISHFEEHLEEIPADVTLWIIPTANPDGLAKGTRRNAHGVDLNRNAYNEGDSCTENDWVADTYTTEGIIEGGGGPYPFSEVETRVLRDFLEDAQAVVFYHSMAGMILVTSCADHPPSTELGRCLSQATGYPFAEAGWASYPVTGAMVDYLAYRGIAAAEVELTTKMDTELERNLAGVRAVFESLPEIVSAS